MKKRKWQNYQITLKKNQFLVWALQLLSLTFTKSLRFSEFRKYHLFIYFIYLFILLQQIHITAVNERGMNHLHLYLHQPVIFLNIYHFLKKITP